MSHPELRDRAVDALKTLPGAIALHEFGSRAVGNADAWSDIDVQLITEDLAATVAGRGASFASIAPVIVEWEIQQTASQWAATVLFAGASPLCHLDIGFSTPVASGQEVMLENSRLVWTQAPVGRVDRPVPAWYSPKSGSIEHMVIGELLGIVRYVKARRRKQDLLCWKFFSALANKVLEATYLAQVDRQRKFGKPLTSWEHVRLRGVLLHDESRRLAAMMMAGDEAGMDRSMTHLGAELISLGGTLEDVSDAYRTMTTTLLHWIDRALHDQEFDDALW